MLSLTIFICKLDSIKVGNLTLRLSQKSLRYRRRCGHVSHFDRARGGASLLIETRLPLRAVC